MIYFDYAASTPINKEVLEIYKEISQKHYALIDTDKKSKELQKKYSTKIKEKIKAQNFNIYYTSGGSESNTLAIMGIAQKNNQKTTRYCSCYRANRKWKIYHNLLCSYRCK